MRVVHTPPDQNINSCTTVSHAFVSTIQTKNCLHILTGDFSINLLNVARGWRLQPTATCGR